MRAYRNGARSCLLIARLRQRRNSRRSQTLNSRLEYQFTVSQDSDDPEAEKTAYSFRKNATLTYLASAPLERLISIWADESAEEEKALVADEANQNGTYYSAHARALQTFIEKVGVFRAAAEYKDYSLIGGEVPETFKLAPLYDRHFEYAEILSAQGL